MSNNLPRAIEVLLRLLAVCLMAVVSCSVAVGAEWPEDARDLICRAGNAESDSQRLDILKQLSKDARLDAAARADIRSLETSSRPAV